MNDHSVTGDRRGKRAVYIKGTGKGRGAGRIIYKVGKDGEVNIIKIITDHRY